MSILFFLLYCLGWFLVGMLVVTPMVASGVKFEHSCPLLLAIIFWPLTIFVLLSLIFVRLCETLEQFLQKIYYPRKGNKK